jgi:hypothetical protein
MNRKKDDNISGWGDFEAFASIMMRHFINGNRMIVFGRGLVTLSSRFYHSGGDLNFLYRVPLRFLLRLAFCEIIR